MPSNEQKKFNGLKDVTFSLAASIKVQEKHQKGRPEATVESGDVVAVLAQQSIDRDRALLQDFLFTCDSPFIQTLLVSFFREVAKQAREKVTRETLDLFYEILNNFAQADLINILILVIERKIKGLQLPTESNAMFEIELFKPREKIAA